MPRGTASEVGTTRVANNGYHYTKTEDRGWILTHHLTAEAILGRLLHDHETVAFKEPKYKREPHNPNGIVITEKRIPSLRRRKAYLEGKIREMQDEIAAINEKLGI